MAAKIGSLASKYDFSNALKRESAVISSMAKSILGNKPFVSTKSNANFSGKSSNIKLENGLHYLAVRYRDYYANAPRGFLSMISESAKLFIDAFRQKFLSGGKSGVNKITGRLSKSLKYSRPRSTGKNEKYNTYDIQIYFDKNIAQGSINQVGTYGTKVRTRPKSGGFLAVPVSTSVQKKFRLDEGEDLNKYSSQLEVKRFKGRKPYLALVYRGTNKIAFILTKKVKDRTIKVDLNKGITTLFAPIKREIFGNIKLEYLQNALAKSSGKNLVEKAIGMDKRIFESSSGSSFVISRGSDVDTKDVKKAYMLKRSFVGKASPLSIPILREYSKKSHIEMVRSRLSKRGNYTDYKKLLSKSKTKYRTSSKLSKSNIESKTKASYLKTNKAIMKGLVGGKDLNIKGMKKDDLDLATKHLESVIMNARKNKTNKTPKEMTLKEYREDRLSRVKLYSEYMSEKVVYGKGAKVNRLEAAKVGKYNEGLRKKRIKEYTKKGEKEVDAYIEKDKKLREKKEAEERRQKIHSVTDTKTMQKEEDYETFASKHDEEKKIYGKTVSFKTNSFSAIKTKLQELKTQRDVDMFFRALIRTGKTANDIAEIKQMFPDLVNKR